jgi:hypothetical protein
MKAVYVKQKFIEQLQISFCYQLDCCGALSIHSGLQKM